MVGDNGSRQVDAYQDALRRVSATSGDVVVDGKPVSFASPREALDARIATVFQDLAMILLSITRNFFMGREPVKKMGPFAFIDMAFADKVARSLNAKDWDRCARSATGSWHALWR